MLRKFVNTRKKLIQDVAGLAAVIVWRNYNEESAEQTERIFKAWFSRQFSKRDQRLFTTRRLIDVHKMNEVKLTPVFIFAHIPKCAGATLQRSLKKVGHRRRILLYQTGKTKNDTLEFLNRRIAKQRTSSDQISVISGHDVFYGLHRHIGRPAYYFTFIRHPVDRYFSNYCFLRDCSRRRFSVTHRHLRHVQEYAKKKLFENGRLISIEECVDRKYFSNMMIKKMGAWADPDLTTGLVCREGIGRCRELAMSFLRNLSFIGHVESFAEDISSLCDVVGVSPVRRITNRSSARFSNHLTDNLRREIQLINQHDMWIYEQAMNLRNELKSKPLPVCEIDR